MTASTHCQLDAGQQTVQVIICIYKHMLKKLLETGHLLALFTLTLTASSQMLII